MFKLSKKKGFVSPGTRGIGHERKLLSTIDLLGNFATN